jgi:hypothetical protein
MLTHLHNLNILKAIKNYTRKKECIKQIKPTNVGILTNAALDTIFPK